MCSKSSCLFFLALTSSGDLNVLFSSLQACLVCGPHLNLFDVIFYFFRDYDTVDKANEVCRTLYMPTKLEQNAEKKKAQSSDFLEVRYISIWWKWVNLNKVIEAPNMAYYHQ